MLLFSLVYLDAWSNVYVHLAKMSSVELRWPKERRRSWNVQVVVTAARENHAICMRVKGARINAMNVSVGAKTHILAKNAKQISILTTMVSQQENHNLLK